MQINYALIPEATMETLIAWVERGRPMGGFCEAVISNDLMEAFRRADENNIRALFHICAWLHNEAPIGSYGSRDCLRSWPARLSESEEVA